MLKTAFIGAGNIFENTHLPLFRKQEECELSAIMEVHDEKAKEIARKHGIPEYFTNIDKLLDVVRPDIVVVCTPNKFHHSMTIKALNAGAHVLCEKPPAMTAYEAKEMATLAEKNKKVLAYNLHYRHSNEVSFLKKQIDNGVLGDIYSVKVQALRRRGIPGWGNFISKEAQGGGPLIDIGIHMLDVALYLMGYPAVKSVEASQYTEIGNRRRKGTFGYWDPEKFDVEDSCFAFIKFKNNASLFLETSFALNIKQRSVMNVELYGNLSGASVFPLEIYLDRDGELVDEIYPFVSTMKNEHYAASIKSFVDKCLGKETMIATAYEGYMLQKIIEDIYNTGGNP